MSEIYPIKQCKICRGIRRSLQQTNKCILSLTNFNELTTLHHLCGTWLTPLFRRMRLRMQLTLTKGRQCIVKFIDWQVTTIFLNLRRTLTISTRQGSATTGLAQASLQAWQLGLAIPNSLALIFSNLLMVPTHP